MPAANLKPEPLIPGLVPDQPAPGAVTDREHKATYCRGRPPSYPSPRLTGPQSPGQPTRADVAGAAVSVG
jgi:hypothetical protein